MMMENSILSAEQQLLALKYGDRFEAFGGKNFSVSFNEDLSFFSISEGNDLQEAIVNENGVEIDVKSIYQSFIDGNEESSGVEMCKWIETKFLCREEAYGFDDIYLNVASHSEHDTSEDTPDDNIDISNQVILIYSWGNGCRVRKPEGSHANFSACGITCLKKGLNLKSLTGKHKSIQECVRESSQFRPLIQSIIDTVREDSSITTISINCTRGKHRSVAIAEILKNDIFPCATVQHLEI